MKTIIIDPLKFNGTEFAIEYNISEDSFWISGNNVLNFPTTLPDIPNIDYSSSLIQPAINSISNVKGKDHISLNYKTELKSNIRLYAEETFNDDGTINVVTFYYGYVNNGNKGIEILRVEHVWIVDSIEIIPAAKKIKSRTKTRKWAVSNGVYHSKNKVTNKLYDTTKKIGKEGSRRRENIMSILQTRVITILLLTTISPTQLDAELKLINIFGTYNSGVNTYMKSGKGTIYTDVLNDVTYSWLNTIIGTTAQTALGLPAGWDVKTIRDYVIDKLKGLV